jgi:putative two-component system response regulator
MAALRTIDRLHDGTGGAGMDNSSRFGCSPGNVLIVDDDEGVRAVLSEALRREGHITTEIGDGEAALTFLKQHAPDIVVLDCDLPGIPGLQVLRELKSDPSTQLIPTILITGRDGLADRMAGIRAGADEFLAKPVQLAELILRVHALVRTKRMTDGLDSPDAAFLALARAIDARDPLTQGHSERVARNAARIGRALGLAERDLDVLQRGSLLHDIGKIGVPDVVLFKQDRLNEEEWRIMRRHADVGDAVCEPLRSLQKLRPIVRFHHERLDGSGYPLGLREEEIPQLAQIVAIADVFDALTSARSYRGALPIHRAAEMIVDQGRGGKLNLQYVEAFLDWSPE